MYVKGVVISFRVYVPDDQGCKFLMFILSPCSNGYGRLIILQINLERNCERT